MLEKLADFISEKIVNRIIVLFFLVMSGSVFIQVLFRYCFHKPIYWSEELPRVMLVWLTFLGAGLAMKKQGHLSITLLTNRLGRKTKLLVQIFANIITMIFLFVLIKGGIDITILTMPNRSAALQMPTGLVYLALPTGAAVMCLHLFIQTTKLVKIMSGKSAKGEDQ